MYICISYYREHKFNTVINTNIMISLRLYSNNILWSLFVSFGCLKIRRLKNVFPCTIMLYTDYIFCSCTVILSLMGTHL